MWIEVVMNSRIYRDYKRGLIAKFSNFSAKKRFQGRAFPWWAGPGGPSRRGGGTRASQALSFRGYEVPAPLTLFTRGKRAQDGHEGPIF